MLVWEWRLRVRRAACEFRLFNLRVRHSELTELRQRHPYKGDAWNKKSDLMALVRLKMERELDEIEWVKKQQHAGPVLGGRLVLHVKDGDRYKVRPGPSLIDLIERKRDEYWSKAGEHEDTTAKYRVLMDKGSGLDLALDIIRNPYKYLDPNEQAAFDVAEDQANKIIERSGVNTQERRMIKSVDKQAASLAEIKARGGQMVRRPSAGD